MAKKANPVIHELAVLLASQSEGRLSPSKIQAFYANYLVAVKRTDGNDTKADNLGELPTF